MEEPGENGGGGFGAPARKAGIAVGRIADKRQIVGDGRRGYSKLGDDAGFVADLALPTIQLHDSRAMDALGQVLIRSADKDAIDARVESRAFGGGGQSVVGLEFDHRPDSDPCLDKSLFDERELREKIGIDALPRFIVRP